MSYSFIVLFFKINEAIVVIYISFNFDFVTKYDSAYIRNWCLKFAKRESLVHQFRSVVGSICNWNTNMFMVKYSIINDPQPSQAAWINLDHPLHDKARNFSFEWLSKFFTVHACPCVHTHTYIHLDCIYHFFASSTSCVVGQHYSSHSYNWSLQSQLLSSKSEPCFNIASSARLIIFSLLLTAGLSFLKVTVAFAFLRESSLKFTF